MMLAHVICSGDGRVNKLIKHFRRGIEIQVIAPKVPAHHPVGPSTVVPCTEVIEVSSYLRGSNGDGRIQYVPGPLAYF